MVNDPPGTRIISTPDFVLIVFGVAAPCALTAKLTAVSMTAKLSDPAATRRAITVTPPSWLDQ
jgi:hypothetical protein